MTTGILEGIQAQLARIEAKLDAVRQPEPVPQSDSIWADGAMDLLDAEKFSGISRTEMYTLMRTCELPFATPTRERLVPRRWLVRYLEAKQHRATDVR